MSSGSSCNLPNPSSLKTLSKDGKQFVTEILFDFHLLNTWEFHVYSQIRVFKCFSTSRSILPRCFSRPAPCSKVCSITVVARWQNILFGSKQRIGTEKKLSLGVSALLILNYLFMWEDDIANLFAILRSLNMQVFRNFLSWFTFEYLNDPNDLISKFSIQTFKNDKFIQNLFVKLLSDKQSRFWIIFINDCKIWKT